MDLHGSIPQKIPLKNHQTKTSKVYKWYISGIYCQLGDYMVPTDPLREPGNSIDPRHMFHRTNAQDPSCFEASGKTLRCFGGDDEIFSQKMWWQ